MYMNQSNPYICHTTEPTLKSAFQGTHYMYLKVASCASF